LRSGAIFKHEWWQYYTRGEGNNILPEPARIVTLSSDTAFGTKNKNDWSVNLVAALGVSGILYLLDLYCKRVEFPQLVRDTTTLIKRWVPDRVLIENRGSGISLIQTLSLETLAPVEAINPDMDKLRRAHAVTPFVQSGNVMIPEDAIWKDDFIQQMSDFPNGNHDDMVDAFTQTVNWLIGQSLVLLEGRLLQSAGGFVNAYGKGGELEDNAGGMNLYEFRSFQAHDPFSPRAWMDLA
jgi:predicted phage terminase large subunit-like protein